MFWTLLVYLFAASTVNTVLVSGDDNHCLRAVTACYPNASRNAVKESMLMDPINLGQACTEYSRTVGCIDSARKSNDDCEAVSHAVEDLVKTVTNDVYNVCYKNGSVSVCAVEYKKCSDAFFKIFKNQDSSSSVAKLQSCGYRSVFFTCEAMIMDKALCPPGGLKEQLMASYSDQMKSFNLEPICDTDCGKAVGKCLEDLSLDISQPVLDVSVACPHYAGALTCLKEKKASVCQGDTSNVTDINLAVYGMSDYCSDSGEISQCYADILKCDFDQDKVKLASVEERCQRYSSYLECSDKASCSSNYYDTVVRPFRKELIMEQQNANCAGIGDCATQLDTCTSSLYVNSPNVQSNLPAFCSDARKDIKCVCALKSAQVCSSEQNAIQAVFAQQRVKDIIQKCADAEMPLETCGNDGASTVGVTVGLLVVTCLASLLRL